MYKKNAFPHGKAFFRVEIWYKSVWAIHGSPVLLWCGGRFVNRPYRIAKNFYIPGRGHGNLNASVPQAFFFVG